LRKRGAGYGIFNTAYGLAVFLGSSLLGLFYYRSIYLLIAGVVFLEVLAFAVFFLMHREIVKEKGG
jgi:predicted MFS family arabinose efflux permease